MAIPRWTIYVTAAAVTMVLTAWLELSGRAHQVPPSGAGGPPGNRTTASIAPSMSPRPAPLVRQPALPPAAAAPEPSAPPLPFTYVGHWVEGAAVIVLLRRGEALLTVRGVGMLDAQYAVEAIDSRRLLLKHLPLGKTTVLMLQVPVVGAATTPAQAVGRGGAAGTATAAGTSEPDDSERIGN